ncbi:MAG: FprA family A-type flavoprotein [Bacillota bacterium]|nr:FprA family A-type flavoprotein [Bacillota bacterium]
MKAVKVKDNIYWVGAVDWEVRNFHGYLTQRGATYNAYLVIDEKITLIDTVKAGFENEILERVKSVVPLDKIDYIVVNHIEKDHSGAFPKVREALKNATLVCDAKAQAGLKAHYHTDYEAQLVKTGDTLNTGKYNFTFVQTPMVHWPDSMVTYLAEEKTLFPNDAFGQHFASSQRFDKDVPLDLLMYEAGKYYANIVLPFGKQVGKALEALGGLKIDTICPSHGFILQERIPDFLDAYTRWASNAVKEKAVIVVDSMWHATEKMAKAIYTAFENQGVEVKYMSLKDNHHSDVMAEILEAKYVAVGSPTLNNGIMPTVAGFLCYMQGLAPKDRIGLPFGSYGWSGQSVGVIKNAMEAMKWQVIDNEDVYRLVYEPTQEQLDKITKATEEAIKSYKK